MSARTARPAPWLRPVAALAAGAAGLLVTGCAAPSTDAATEPSAAVSSASPAVPPAASSVPSVVPAAALPSTYSGQPVGAPLAGSWLERAADGAPYVWTLSPAGSADCRDVVRTTDSCYVIRTQGVPQPEDWGEARMVGTVLVTRQRGGIPASRQCVGQVSSYRFSLQGQRAVVEKGGCRAGDSNYLSDGGLTRLP